MFKRAKIIHEVVEHGTSIEVAKNVSLYITYIDFHCGMLLRYSDDYRIVS